MKKIAVLLLCLFSSFGVFPETVYKVSSVSVSKCFIQENYIDTEKRSGTHYFVKDKNVLEKYLRDENGRISEEMKMQALCRQDSVLVMIMDGQALRSLYEIKFIGGNSISINEDVYVLEKESYDRLYADTIKKSYYSEMRIDAIFSLFSMTPYFLIDGILSNMPYDLFCDVAQYKILSGRFSAQDPQATHMLLEHVCAYEYDESGRLAKMTFRCENPGFLGVRYSWEVTKRNGKEIFIKDAYSLFERMSGTSVIHFDFDKNECDMAGDDFSVPTLKESVFSKTIRCEQITKSKHELQDGYFER